MATGQKSILSLYRNLLKESKKWSLYNYREYALRKVKYEFRQNKTLTDSESIAKCYEKGLETLEMLKRQVILGDLYGTRPLVIETKKSSEAKNYSGIR
ncbi:hypothetical protein PV325_013431 [Microctonus aethiopoides]|uniref:Complex 1 LYR protein domain-containing protein n=1 Tax=Microctonus aethiopoides TaxID=144406 RepID=A0AA39FKI1_9HYME|nr:hypothetical protein PV325_013431 [Microctonus aethiopoides]KAK0098224.1 hypothetical protein PV326_010281 [Microctonus aethiopoides]KAK0171285.1 hypothetical protein PV328_009033 [Microctonus aethiopoides]